MKPAYRDPEEAAIARADSLQRENADLRAQLTALTSPLVRARARVRLAIGVAALFVGAMFVGAVFLLRFANITLPSPDSPPGVTGTLEIDVTPTGSQVTIDDHVPMRANAHLSIPGLDPNFPHRIRVSDPACLPYDQYVTVPAHGVRTLAVHLNQGE